MGHTKAIDELEKNTYEAKNFKRFYVPKTMVIYFSDCNLQIFEQFNKKIVEYTQFVQIGSIDKSVEQKRINHFKQYFFPWLEFKNNEEKIMKPSAFFRTIGKELVKEIESLDLVIIVYKSNDVKVLDYVDELSTILFKNDVFTFCFSVENFVQSEESKKRNKKLIKNLTKKRQVLVPIKEKSIVDAYKGASISNRTRYINSYINNLIDMFLAPFLIPERNPDAFSKIKAIFYQNRKNFDSKIVSSIGYSDDKQNNVDIALINALANPMFAAAFDTSNTFIVSVKMPFFLDYQLDRIKLILKSIVGEWKQFYVLTQIGSFDFTKYCQISIMAVNVDESKLITDPEKIDEYIKKILNNIQKSKQIFEDDLTKDIILEKSINALDS